MMDDVSYCIAGRDGIRAHVFHNAWCRGTHDFRGRPAGQLHLLRAGVVEFLDEQQPALRIDRPTLLFFPGGLPHRLRVPEGDSAHLLCADIFFHGEGKDVLAQALPGCVRQALHASAGIKTAADLLSHEAELSDGGHDVLLDCICATLIVQLIRQNWCIDEGRGRMAADPRLSKVLSAIHEKPHIIWPLDVLANIAGMSRSKFSVHFRQSIGVSPGAYVIQRRLLAAQDLLRKGFPVKAVCHRVGYTNQPAFTRMFTARTGLSPRAWLANVGGASVDDRAPPALCGEVR